MSELAQKRVRSALSLLTPRRVLGLPKVRVGGERDGGYVMIDDLAATGGIAYSLGVGPDVSWDLAMAERGWTIEQYDHTVDGPPAEHPNCRFHRVGIAPDDGAAGLRRLDTLMREQGALGRRDHILKMDIEGHEWACLDAMPIGFFDHFHQVVAELHWLDHLHSEGFQDLFRRVIGNMRITHECIHVHANNYADIVVTEGVPISPVVEITLVKRALYEFGPNHEVFPGVLDMANDASRPDHYLGLYAY